MREQPAGAVAATLKLSVLKMAIELLAAPLLSKSAGLAGSLGGGDPLSTALSMTPLGSK